MLEASRHADASGGGGRRARRRRRAAEGQRGGEQQGGGLHRTGSAQSTVGGMTEYDASPRSAAVPPLLPHVSSWASDATARSAAPGGSGPQSVWRPRSSLSLHSLRTGQHAEDGTERGNAAPQAGAPDAADEPQRTPHVEPSPQPPQGSSSNSSMRSPDDGIQQAQQQQPRPLPLLPPRLGFPGAPGAMPLRHDEHTGSLRRLAAEASGSVGPALPGEPSEPLSMPSPGQPPLGHSHWRRPSAASSSNRPHQARSGADAASVQMHPLVRPPITRDSLPLLGDPFGSPSAERSPWFKAAGPGATSSLAHRILQDRPLASALRLPKYPPPQPHIEATAANAVVDSSSPGRALRI